MRTLFRCVLAVLSLLLIGTVGPATLLAQDSASVSAIAEVSNNMGMLTIGLASVGLLSFVLWQLIKFVSTKADGLPPWAHKFFVFAVASGLTALGTVIDFPLPTTLASLTQDDTARIVTWLVTILFGGGGAIASHAAKKATVG